jgi:hypothetical protein
LLAAGSPAVFVYRSFEYTRAIGDLHERHMERPTFWLRADTAIMLLEFIIAAASIANVAEFAWQLAAEAIFSLLPNTPYVAVLWVFLGMIIHMFGALALFLRTNVVLKPKMEKIEHPSNSLDPANTRLGPLARKDSVRVSILPESWVSAFVTWVASVFTACHIIFGTLLFSSLLFISVNDSLVMIARLMASVIVCRIVLTYELTVLRKAVEVDGGEKD